MTTQARERSSSARSALFDPPEASLESPEKVQLKRSLGGMGYAEQVEAVKPPVPVDTVQTLNAGPIQHQDGGDATAVRETAAQGLQGSASSLPYLGHVQSAFGHHDVSGIRSHTGGAAQQANAAMGSLAYATGNAVAFKGTPNLHTVAHEAAHVVQQRAGVSLPGGVGQTGDTYEKHADAVADRVVRGQSAAPLLDAATGGRESMTRAVQMKHGDLGTTVDPSLTGGQQMTVREAVEAGHPGMAREKETFNNKLKVKFEQELALTLTSNPAFYEGTVHNVSTNIMAYIRAKVGAEEGNVGAAVRDELAKLEGMYGHMGGELKPTLLYGRIMDVADKANIGEVLDKLIGVLDRGEGTISNHMFAHHQFMDNIYNVDFYAGREGMGAKNSVAAKTLAKVNASFAAIEPKYLRAVAAGNPFGLQMDGEGKVVHVEVKTDKKAVGTQVTTPGYGKYNELENTGKGDKHARGRKFSGELAGANGQTSRSGIATEDEAGTRLAGSTVPEGQDSGQTHGRGVDIYIMDEAQTFIQEARVKYDMPLAAGVSGTTTDLLECAMTFGVTEAEEKFKYVLGCLDQLMNAGAHSFHEIMSAAAFAGVTYVPGDYRSLMQYPAITALLQPLFAKTEYADVWGIGANAPTPPQQLVTVPAAATG